jgi:RHS repeat-associated protein
VGNVTTYYYGLLEEEVNSGTGVTTRRLQYKWGGSVIAQREKATTSSVETVVYLAGDHLGSVSVATNATGGYANGTSQQQLFDPWGKIRSGTLTSTTTLNYTGQKLDATGLLFYNARYYDPTIAKFVSADSIVPDAKNSQSYNRYAYVLGNPTNYKDPTGHCTVNASSPEERRQCRINVDYIKNIFNSWNTTISDADLLERWTVAQIDSLISWISRGVKFTSDDVEGNGNFLKGRAWNTVGINSVLGALNKVSRFLKDNYKFSDSMIDKAFGLVDKNGQKTNLIFNYVQEINGPNGIPKYADGAGALYRNEANRIDLNAYTDPTKGEYNIQDHVLVHEFGHVMDRNAAIFGTGRDGWWSVKNFTLDLGPGYPETFANIFADLVNGNLKRSGYWDNYKAERVEEIFKVF